MEWKAEVEWKGGLYSLMWDGSSADCTQVALRSVAEAHQRQTLASPCEKLFSSPAQNLALAKVAEACWHGQCQP